MAPGKTVRIRVADKALEAMKERVRRLTRRICGRSLGKVAQDLRAYLLGWKGYFRLADTPKVFRELDEWIRHRLRAIQLKQWKRGRTVYRELVARGTQPGPGGADRREHSPMVEERGDGPSHRTAQSLVRPAGASPTGRVTSTSRTAGCGPACPVVWEGSDGQTVAPYPDRARARGFAIVVFCGAFSLEAVRLGRRSWPSQTAVERPGFSPSLFSGAFWLTD